MVKNCKNPEKLLNLQQKSQKFPKFKSKHHHNNLSKTYWEEMNQLYHNNHKRLSNNSHKYNNLGVVIY